MQSLDQQIMAALAAYTEDVREGIAEVLEDVGNEATKKLKTTSPKLSGRYRRSWKLKLSSRDGSTEVIAYNAKHYQLTHLLEHGHRTRNHQAFVAARPHIAEVEDWAREEANRRIREVLGR